MPQSLARIWLHIVFSTKHRRPLLRDAALRDEMFRMAAHHAGKIDCPAERVGGWQDHVHMLCQLARTVTVADLAERVKRETSKWVKDRRPRLAEFQWQAGYAVFSVSESLVARVAEYIDRQSEHHRELSFQDELRALCAKHRVAIDERYVWD